MSLKESFGSGTRLIIQVEKLPVYKLIVGIKKGLKLTMLCIRLKRSSNKKWFLRSSLQTKIINNLQCTARLQNIT